MYIEEMGRVALKELRGEVWSGLYKSPTFALSALEPRFSAEDCHQGGRASFHTHLPDSKAFARTPPSS